MNIPAILDRAATVIEKNGHHKGDYFDEKQAGDLVIYTSECRVCALGAIIVGAGGNPLNGLLGTDSEPAARDAARAFALHLHNVEATASDSIKLVGDWNDAPERTAEDVTTRLRACAASLRAAA
ncbi:hypothetical protein EDD29_0134 [Actinocorallia herbida]|uniref:Uncharacterized protein n=1 Tax=Actinocorallia herbida TaxID=58109 RepID=A0A3N1CMY9_9ACTN|nr:hypothetical protein [Actinocorallia herbida]ROO82653.1 hypothetical protein EDD29_0134 [Actinocorallia herbida]